MKVKTSRIKVSSRHRSLSEAIDWSYRLLPEEVKLVFASLAVFSGGWTREAASAVCASHDVDGARVDDFLADLEERSLVFTEQGAQTRFRMLETLRDFAAGMLRKRGEDASTRLRHAKFYANFAESAEPYLSGNTQMEWLDHLEADIHNFRAALDWMESTDEHAEIHLRLSAALYGFWDVRGYAVEGRHRLATMLQRGGGNSTLRAKALTCAASLANTQRDYSGALSFNEESLNIYRELDDQRGIATSLSNLGNAAYNRRDYAEAYSFHEESLTMYRKLEDKRGIAWALHAVGNSLSKLGYTECPPMYSECLALFQELDDEWGIAMALINLGRYARSDGDLTLAQSLHERSLAIGRALKNKWLIVYSLNCLGEVAGRQGNFVRALALSNESLETFRTWDDRPNIAWVLDTLAHTSLHSGNLASARSFFMESLTIRSEFNDLEDAASSAEGFAKLAIAVDDWEQAGRLLASVAEYRRANSITLLPGEKESLKCLVAALQTRMSDESFKAVWTEGSTLTLKNAIVCVRSWTVATPLAPTNASASFAG